MSDDDVAKLQPFLTDAQFSVEVMKSKSAAAANLCNWVVNIVKFNRIYVKVKFLLALY